MTLTQVRSLVFRKEVSEKLHNPEQETYVLLATIRG